MKISLIALGVSDIAKSVAFYRDKAGFVRPSNEFNTGTKLLKDNRHRCHRRPKNDDIVEGGSGFLAGSSSATRFVVLRHRPDRRTGVGLAAAGSSAFMARR